MPYAILNPNPGGPVAGGTTLQPGGEDGHHAWKDYSYRDELPTYMKAQGGPWQTQRGELDPRSRRVYSWPAGLDDDQRLTWQAFLEGVGWTRDAFLVRDPIPEDSDRLGVSLGVGNGVLTTFPLPTSPTDPEYRYYMQPGTERVYLAGVLQAAAAYTVNQDERTVTFAAPPGAVAVTADYRGLRLVRLEEAPEAAGMEYGYTRYTFALAEILRDSTARGRFFYGDLELWREAARAPVEQPTRRVAQVFDGVDQLEALVVGNSPNHQLVLRLPALGFPNPASATTKGWLAISRQMRRDLWDRGLRTDPVAWVEDLTLSKAVQTYVAGLVTTTTAHGLVVGQVVLIRKKGVGNWLLGNVATTPSGTTFTVSMSAGMANPDAYVPVAADDVHVVEAWWGGCAHGAVDAMQADVETGAWFAQEVAYRFTTSGRYSWAATDATAVSA